MLRICVRVGILVAACMLAACAYETFDTLRERVWAPNTARSFRRMAACYIIYLHYHWGMLLIMPYHCCHAQASKLYLHAPAAMKPGGCQLVS